MENKKRLIDPSAYRKELYEERDYPGRTQEFMDAIEVAIADLCDMPTVDAVEVVHGGWKDGVCGACGFDIRDMIDGDSDFRNWVWDGLPYCPNCGAKMDKED